VRGAKYRIVVVFFFKIITDLALHVISRGTGYQERTVIYFSPINYSADSTAKKLKGAINLDSLEQVDSGLTFESGKVKYQVGISPNPTTKPNH
jgi:hypothetical protein